MLRTSSLTNILLTQPDEPIDGSLARRRVASDPVCCAGVQEFGEQLCDHMGCQRRVGSGATTFMAYDKIFCSQVRRRAYRVCQRHAELTHRSPQTHVNGPQAGSGSH